LVCIWIVLNFIYILRSESGWVGSLNHQLVVGRAGSDRVTRFDSSRKNEWKSHHYCNGVETKSTRL